MARKAASTSTSTSPAVSSTPAAGERQGKRAHDEHGNVRPADGRWDLHDPQEESTHVKGNTDG